MNNAEDFADFSKAKVLLDRLIDDWSEEIAESKTRRSERYVDLDINSLRASGAIRPDETFIPERVIDQNILREQPAYINFLSKSKRLAIFQSLDDPSYDSQKLEREFSQGIRYAGWLTAHYKLIDGFQLHGWTALEVVYDETKPMNVAVEYIPHDRLFFPISGLENIQDAEYIIRSYCVTSLQLRRFVASHNFDAEQVNKLLENNKESRKRNEKHEIYKCYYKVDGLVSVAWYCRDTGVNAWLKKPEPLYLGIVESTSPTQASVNTGNTNLTQGGVTPNNGVGSTNFMPRQLDMYPVFVFDYRESEDEEMTSKVGRHFLDQPKQEARTAIVSGFVNRLSRSANVYGSVDGSAETETQMRQLDIKLQHGGIYSKKVNFFSMDPPDSTILQSINYLETKDAADAGNTAYAVMNRKDARKTATELSLAEKDSNLIDTVPLSLFSEKLREVLSFMWKIVQSQALQNNIKLLQIPVVEPRIDPMTFQIVEQTRWTNDVANISQNFDVRPAGDVDYVERSQKITQMKQDWPVIAQTGAKNEFLKDLIKLEYPENGEKYASLITQQDPALMLVNQLATILKGSLEQGGGIATLDTAQTAQLQQVDAAVQQLTGQSILPGQQG